LLEAAVEEAGSSHNLLVFECLLRLVEHILHVSTLAFVLEVKQDLLSSIRLLLSGCCSTLRAASWRLLAWLGLTDIRFREEDTEKAYIQVPLVSLIDERYDIPQEHLLVDHYTVLVCH